MFSPAGSMPTDVQKQALSAGALQPSVTNAIFLMRSSKKASWKSQPKSGARICGAATSQGRAPNTTTGGKSIFASSTDQWRLSRVM